MVNIQGKKAILHNTLEEEEKKMNLDPATLLTKTTRKKD